MLFLFLLVLLFSSSGKDKFKSKCKSCYQISILVLFIPLVFFFPCVLYVSCFWHASTQKLTINLSNSNDLNNTFAGDIYTTIQPFYCYHIKMIFCCSLYTRIYVRMPIIPLFHHLRTNNERFLIVVWRNIMEGLKKMTYIKRNAVKYFGNQLITSSVRVKISVYFLNCVTGISRDTAFSCQYLLYRSTSDTAVSNCAFLDSGKQRDGRWASTCLF